MQRALELARATLGLASPNPQVGCVLAHDNIIVGEGAHRYDPRDHAEVVALKMAGEKAQGSTAYVTLEPCSHHGRTGPCANALIDAGVARVVTATLDPNPLVAGQGMARMQAAGIIAEHGLLQDEARSMNDSFARYILTGMPLVTLKSALSADGMLAPLPVHRPANAPFWLTGTAAREEVHRFRHANDAILTGIGTVLADDPLMTDRSNGQRRRRLLRVVLDTQLRTPISSRLVESANDDLLIFCVRNASADRQRQMRQRGVRVETLPALAPEEQAAPVDRCELDLRAALKRLGELEILSVLLEAGPGLNGAFLSADLVDKAVLFFAPQHLGEGAVPFSASGDSAASLVDRLQSIDRCDFVNEGNDGERQVDACVRGSLHDPWAETFALS